MPGLMPASVADCEFAIRRGALVAVMTGVSAIVALVVYRVGVATPDWIALPSVLAHVAIVSVLAILVLRKGRAASVVLLVYLITAWIVVWWLGQLDALMFQVSAVLVTAMIVVFNSLAVLATFRWHKLKGSENPAAGIARVTSGSWRTTLQALFVIGLTVFLWGCATTAGDPAPELEFPRPPEPESQARSLYTCDPVTNLCG
jgi:hypothetical protein